MVFLSALGRAQLMAEVKLLRRQVKKMKKELLPHPAAAALDALLKGEKVVVEDKTYAMQDGDIHFLHEAEIPDLKDEETGAPKKHVIPVKTGIRVKDWIKKFKDT